MVVGDDLVLGRADPAAILLSLAGTPELVADSHVGGNVSVIGGDAEVSQAAQIGGNIAVVGRGRLLDWSLTGRRQCQRNWRKSRARTSRPGRRQFQLEGLHQQGCTAGTLRRPAIKCCWKSGQSCSNLTHHRPPSRRKGQAQGATAELQAQAAQMQEEAQRAATELQAQVARIQEETQRAQAEFEAQANLGFPSTAMVHHLPGKAGAGLSVDAAHHRALSYCSSG